MYIFLHKKESTFYQTFHFRNCKMYVWLEITNTYTTKQLIICFHQLVLNILCKRFVQ